MIQTLLPALAQVALEQNYRHEIYLERHGLPGIITWWSEIKHDVVPEGGVELVITTNERYGKIIINGKVFNP